MRPSLSLLCRVCIPWIAVVAGSAQGSCTFLFVNHSAPQTSKCPLNALLCQMFVRERACDCFSTASASATGFQYTGAIASTSGMHANPVAWTACTCQGVMPAGQRGYGGACTRMVLLVRTCVVPTSAHTRPCPATCAHNTYRSAAATASTATSSHGPSSAPWPFAQRSRGSQGIRAARFCSKWPHCSTSNRRSSASHRWAKQFRVAGAETGVCTACIWS
jgi:hypothetical protein|mmetsp:Transcript_40038/g.66684  ORF Transcript_40038/g.66684 Transcript_40038/m.66684 type:complete len:219 (-) Transcript_40038:1303-1959(-)